MGLDLLIALALVVANGFFVATEFALTRVRPTQVVDWEQERRPGAKSVRHAVDRIDAYLAACQLGITVASLGLGVSGKPAFEELLEPLMGEAAPVGGVALAAGTAFGIITLLHVVVGELAPKSLAIARTERTVLWIAPPMRVFYIATRPLVDFFNFLGNLLLRPFGIPPARDVGSVPHTETELRALLRESGRQGLIDPEEQLFGDNVLTFGDRRAREVMRPRPEVVWVPADASAAEAGRQVIEAGLTRLPVCEPDAGLDAPIGVIHAKDLLAAALEGSDAPVRGILRPITRVADAVLIDDALAELRHQREHITLVVDEHGTTVGLLTLEDILEEIVGEIEDEFDRPVEQTIVRDGDGWLIRGSAALHEVEQALETDLPDSHHATISGYVLERLGRVPQAGEEVPLDGVTAEVITASDAHVDELRVAGRGTGDPDQASS